MDNRPIGVFDSGLGGLTVVKELMKELQNESIVYFGDTARIPYGTRSKETVTRFSAQCIRFLLSKDIKMVVIACNTASASSFDDLTAQFKLPIIGVIRPGAGAAVEATRNGRVGVIGTSATIRSKAYPIAIKEINPDIQVFDEACSLFVPIVEEGWSDTEIGRMVAERYLQNIKNQNVDTLVMGCTHYPLLEKTFAAIMGPEVKLINPAVNTVRQVRRMLEDNNMMNDSSKPASVSFYVSDIGQNFQAIGSKFLHQEVMAESINIENY